MNRKELSEAVAEAAARTEAAAALQQEARVRQEAATARWEATQADAAERSKLLDGLLAKQDTLIAKVVAQLEEMKADRARAEAREARFDAEREDEKTWRTEYLRRQEKMFREFFKRAEALVAEGTLNTEKILARIDDQRDDLRAMKEAILKLIDRFPPPPPHLRSA